MYKCIFEEKETKKIVETYKNPENVPEMFRYKTHFICFAKDKL